MPGSLADGFLARAWSRILVFDGAMGTSIAGLNLSPDDFAGHSDCNEYLNRSRPDTVARIHADFFAAGAQVTETNTFGGARHILAEHRLAAQCYDLNRRAAEIARKVARDFSTRANPRFVAGSIGPGSKLPSLGQTSSDDLKESFRPQVEGLLAGGADCLIIETCQDLLQTKAALKAAFETFKTRGKGVPVIVSVTVNKQGQMLTGSDMSAVLAAIEPMPVQAIGVNCSLGPQGLASSVWYLADHSSRLLLLSPNAGLPRIRCGVLHWELSPEQFASEMKALAENPGVNIVGGCCGTGPEHIRQLVQAVADIEPRRPARYTPRISSLYRAQEIEVRPKPLICGERTNASGSRRFRDLLMKEDREGMVAIALAQEKDQAHLIDLSVAAAGRRELSDVCSLTELLNTRVRLPVMVDSTSPEVVEAALKRLAGRCIVNSVNLEDGGKRAKHVIELCRQYGAALVCMTIDRRGMAMTAAHKIVTARRLYDLALKDGLSPESLFFDFLTFTLASGEPKLRSAALETLKALKAAKRLFPRSFTLLGVSNVSHGLTPQARRVLNAVFLHRAIEHGLDAAILHAGQITPLHLLPAQAVRLCDDLIFNVSGHDPVRGHDPNRVRGHDPNRFGLGSCPLTDTPLERLIRYFEKREAALRGHDPIASIGIVSPDKKGSHPLTPQARLRRLILAGDTSTLSTALDEALAKRPALSIIDHDLLPAMAEVGRLFSRGSMQLPFVLRSAETMHKALDLLKPSLGKAGARTRGTLVLATVRGDIHDIGKNLVDMIVSSNGFKVVNLGVRQPPERIITAVKRHKADAVGLSGLLIESARAMREYLEVFASAGVKLPVICGGAALNRDYVRRELQPAYPGKVLYAPDAIAGLKIMQKIVASSSSADSADSRA